MFVLVRGGKDPIQNLFFPVSQIFQIFLDYL